LHDNQFPITKVHRRFLRRSLMAIEKDFIGGNPWPWLCLVLAALSGFASMLGIKPDRAI